MMFAIHGVPEVLLSGNSPPYVSQEITDFANSYGFTKVTIAAHSTQEVMDLLRKLSNQSRPCWRKAETHT